MTFRNSCKIFDCKCQSSIHQNLEEKINVQDQVQVNSCKSVRPRLARA